MIINYDPKYNEQIKDLLLELGKYLSRIDKEGYNVIGEDYKEKYFSKTIEEVEKYNGKIMLYEENQKIVGLIVAVVNNEQISTYDFEVPKRGRITELIVTEEYRGKKIGKKLLKSMRGVFERYRLQKNSYRSVWL